MNLAFLFKQHKKSLIFAISLVIIEHLAWIIEPTVFGNVIDAMIDVADDEISKAFYPLVIWIGVFLINSGTGAFRRSIDPKYF